MEGIKPERDPDRAEARGLEVSGAREIAEAFEWRRGAGRGLEAEDGGEPGARRAGERDLTDRCVSVVLGGSTYGIPIRDVQEIIASRPLTQVFKAPPAVAGVTSLRGEILTVLDLPVLLGIARESREVAPQGHRIIVVRGNASPRRRAGLRVDALGPVRELPRGIEGLSPPPPTLGPRLRAFVRGVIHEAPLCAVLDVDRLFDAPVLAALAGRRAEGA